MLTFQFSSGTSIRFPVLAATAFLVVGCGKGEQPVNVNSMSLIPASSQVEEVSLALLGSQAQDDNPPNVIRTSNGFSPAPGYSWLNDTPGDFRVRWTPGLEHPTAPNVIAAMETDEWATASGYSWVNEDANDLRVRWTPGKNHRTAPNVVASERENIWSPAPGYRWANDTPGDLGVVPVGFALPLQPTDFTRPVNQPDEEAVTRAIVKILGAVVANELGRDDPEDNILGMLFRGVIREGRDEMIESAVRDLFPDMSRLETQGIRRVISLGLDGQLNERNWRSVSARDQLIARLQRENVELANAARAADFLAKLFERHSAR